MIAHWRGAGSERQAPCRLKKRHRLRRRDIALLLAPLLAIERHVGLELLPSAQEMVQAATLVDLPGRQRGTPPQQPLEKIRMFGLESTSHGEQSIPRVGTLRDDDVSANFAIGRAAAARGSLGARTARRPGYP